MYPSEAMVNIWLAEELQGTLARQEEVSLDTNPRFPSKWNEKESRLQCVHTPSATASGPGDGNYLINPSPNLIRALPTSKQSNQIISPFVAFLLPRPAPPLPKNIILPSSLLLNFSIVARLDAQEAHEKVVVYSTEYNMTVRREVTVRAPILALLLQTDQKQQNGRGPPGRIPSEPSKK